MSAQKGKALWAGRVLCRLTNIKSTQKRWWWDKRCNSKLNEQHQRKETDCLTNANLYTWLRARDAQNSTRLKRSYTISATQRCYGDQCRFGTRLRKLMCCYSNSIMNTKFLSLTCFHLLYYPTFSLSIKSCMKFSPLFVNNYSLTSNRSPAS